MTNATSPYKDAYWHRDWWGNHLPNEYATNGAHYNEWYYDQTAVMYDIAQYTGDTTTWYAAMDNPSSWINQYAIDQTPDGNVNGYELYAGGSYYHWLVNGDSAAAKTVNDMANNDVWTQDDANIHYGDHFNFSREIAYTIRTYLYQQLMNGTADRPLYATAVSIAKGHMTQWWTTYVGDWDANGGSMQPFMVGLTMRALIEHMEHSGDSTIPGIIKTALDGLWDYAWMSGSGAMYLNSFYNTTPAPDLSLLIAPAYAWYYNRIVNHGASGTAATYRDRGNLLWDGGVTGADLYTDDGYLGKRFNQNYTWSFKYVEWYNLAEAGIRPSPVLFI